eukprot:CAMPEP_0114544702 /NCGR_PEP_ID=MMETSP0114-20121206/3014_1 /TAXON_ID=31324 /ORGANISM="Goniomonas sp, Strain m" /LENGTH=811 /DNA_ID=CAMNT_0001729093 /DNA_START=57 /DNA_END=2492 /DNA_ORIENTATION=+
MMRLEACSGSNLGEEIKGFDSRGELLPGRIVMDVLSKMVGKLADGSWVLLDGFPRTMDNLEVLSKTWAFRDSTVQTPVSDSRAVVEGAVALTCPDSVVIDRILRRGKQGSGRADDESEEKIRGRLVNYHAQTVPVTEWFRVRGLLVEVDSSGDQRSVFEAFSSALRARGFPCSNLIKICFTGGPAGGKTSALRHVGRMLSAYGFEVLMVPEAPGIVLGGGASLPLSSNTDRDGSGGDPAVINRDLVRWQVALLQVILTLEDSFATMGQTNSMPTVLLCDRGTMDVKAHLPEAAWEQLLTTTGHDEVTLRDKRYDAVVHLESTAVSLHRAYSVGNNAQRTTDLGWGRRLDQRLEEAWGVHPSWHKIGSYPRFDEKMQAVEEAVLSVVKKHCPPRLPLRLLVTAEPFGFGPSAAVGHFFRYLRPRIAHLAYAGLGFTLDIQRQLPYDEVLDLKLAKTDEDSSAQDTWKRVVKNYDAVLVSSDFTFAGLAVEAGVPTAIYDPIAWFWPKLNNGNLPAAANCVDVYIAQDFFGVKEAVAGRTKSETIIVPPIVDAPSADVALGGDGDIGARENAVLINLGGLRNPYLTAAECASFAEIIVRATRPLALEHFDSCQVLTSSDMVQHLAATGACPDASTVLPAEAQQFLGRSRVAVMTPGLGNIYDAALFSERVFWLPAANDSQGMQLRSLQAEGLAPHSADWHELLGDSGGVAGGSDGWDSPIDFNLPQEQVMKRIAEGIRSALGERSNRFECRLRAKFLTALSVRAAGAGQGPTAAPVLRGLVTRFGLGGAANVGTAVHHKLLAPILRERRAQGQ